MLLGFVFSWIPRPYNSIWRTESMAVGNLFTIVLKGYVLCWKQNGAAIQECAEVQVPQGQMHLLNWVFLRWGSRKRHWVLKKSPSTVTSSSITSLFTWLPHNSINCKSRDWRGSKYWHRIIVGFVLFFYFTLLSTSLTPAQNRKVIFSEDLYKRETFYRKWISLEHIISS